MNTSRSDVHRTRPFISFFAFRIKTMRRRSIVITGGAGFLGSHLCGKLLGQGNRIICIDDLYTGSTVNIESYLNNENFIFFEEDICEPLNYLNDLKVDQIYNLACPASPLFYQADPIKTMKTNVFGILNLLEFAQEKKARLLHASTSEVYGDPKEHPQKEEYNGNVNPIGIRACYDEGKRASETLCFDYSRKYFLEIRVIRIFNTYGPRMNPNDGRVVSNFIMQALKEESITIYGDGKQTRSFCYVDDLIDAVIALMNSDHTIAGPVNIGNPDEFTILNLAKKILEKTRSKSKLVYRSLPEDDPRQRKPDISKAKSLLNWFPKISLDEGLNHTIKFFSDSR